MTVATIVIDRGRRSDSRLWPEMWVGSAALTPAAVAAESTVDEATISVPGIKLGDIVDWSYDQSIPDNLVIQCFVSAADTLQVKYTNNNPAAGASITPTAGTLRFLVKRLENSPNPI